MYFLSFLGALLIKQEKIQKNRKEEKKHVALNLIWIEIEAGIYYNYMKMKQKKQSEVKFKKTREKEQENIKRIETLLYTTLFS